MISRRKFLGAAAAAPLAAPIAAKSVATDAGFALPTPRFGGGGPAVSSTLADEIGGRGMVAHIRDEIARYRSEKASAERDAELQYYQSDAFAVDALRSVSGVNKARMLAEKRREREIADRRRYCDLRIAELLKQLSGLGFLEDIL